MGRELLDREPAFRDAVARCSTALGWSVADVLRRELPTNAATVQPLLFALQVGLAALWRSWGIEPAAVVGHSLGEIAAAHVAGVLRLEDAVALVAERGRLMQQGDGNGAMMAVELSADDARRELSGGVSIAAFNAPGAIVVSGDAEEIGELKRRWQEREIRCRLLDVPYASHRPALAPAAAELQRCAARMVPLQGSIPIVSTLTGRFEAGREFDAAYWARQLCQPVQFQGAMETLAEAGFDTFVELGPHSVLAPALVQCFTGAASEPVVVPSIRRDRSDQETALESLGVLHELGHTVVWAQLFPGGGRHVALPAYAWDHKRYWLDLPSEPTREEGGHPLVGRDSGELADLPGMRVWTANLDVDRLAYLQDHRIHGTALFPAAAYLEMAATAGHGAASQVSFERPMVLPASGSRKLQMTVAADGAFKIYSRDDEAWVVHATGTLGATADEGAGFDIREIQERCSETTSGAVFYDRLRESGLEYGTAFQGVQQIWRRDGEALGRIELADADGGYQFHPALLDSCLQVFAASIGGGTAVHVPFAIERFRVYRQPAGVLWSHATLRSASSMTGDLRICDSAGDTVAELAGLRVRKATARIDDCFYGVEWRPRALLDQSLERPDPEYLPAPTSIAARVAPVLATHDLDAYERLAPQLETLAAAYVMRAFQRLGWTADSQPGALDSHRRLVTRLVAILAEESPAVDPSE